MGGAVSKILPGVVSGVDFKSIPLTFYNTNSTEYSIVRIAKQSSDGSLCQPLPKPNDMLCQSR